MLKFLITFSIYIKVINKYYQKHKKRLRKEAREGYQSLSEEKKKDKRRQKDVKILLKKKNKKGISIIKGNQVSFIDWSLKCREILKMFLRV